MSTGIVSETKNKCSTEIFILLHNNCLNGRELIFAHLVRSEKALQCSAADRPVHTVNIPGAQNYGIHNRTF